MFKNKLTNDYIVSKSVKYYNLVAILTVISFSASWAVDGLIIGNFLGNDGLAAFGLASPVIIFIGALAVIFGEGGSVSCFNYAGKGEKSKVNSNFTVAILVSIILALIITICSPLYIHTLSLFLGSNSSLLPFTIDYLSGILIAALPIILFEIISLYIRIDGFSYLEIIVVVLMLIINIILDIVFITVFNMGIFGIALATAIIYTIGILILSTHFFTEENSLRLSKIENGFSEIKKIVINGLPNGLNKIYATFSALIINNLAILIGGSIAMGALTIQSNVNQILSSVAIGIGITTLLLGGIFYGEQDKRSLKDNLTSSLKLGLTIIIPMTIIVIIFAPFIVRAFENNPQVIETGIFSLRLFALSLPTSLVSVIFLNFYNATNNLKIATYIGVTHSFLFIVFFGLFLSPFIGLTGIWLCFVLGEALSLIGLFFVLKIVTGKFPKSLDDFIVVDNDFEKDIKAKLNLSIENNMEEVMDLSNRVFMFGEKYFDDKSLVNKLSLCIEEMVGNIVEHGYESSSDTHYIDMRIIITSKNIIFRIRDDGTPFNPMDFADKHEINEKNIGIHMIQNIAQNIDYRTTIGLNNLNIVLANSDNNEINLKNKLNVFTNKDELIIPAEAEELIHVFSFINKCLKASKNKIKDGNYSIAKFKMQLELSIEEAFTNIVNYAYPSQNQEKLKKEEKIVRIKCNLKENPPRVVIQLFDEGIPYNPLKKQSPDTSLNSDQKEIGGLGIYLIKKNVDHINYEYKDENNILTLEKNF